MEVLCIFFRVAMNGKNASAWADKIYFFQQHFSHQHHEL